MKNTELGSSNSKLFKIKEEFQRFFSIFILPSENDSLDSFEAIKSNVKDENEIAIINELEKNMKKLEQEEITFFSDTKNESINKLKKQSIGKSKKEEINLDIKTSPIKKTISKKSKDIER